MTSEVLDRAALSEDALDLAAFEAPSLEPSHPSEDFVKDLKI